MSFFQIFIDLPMLRQCILSLQRITCFIHLLGSSLVTCPAYVHFVLPTEVIYYWSFVLHPIMSFFMRSLKVFLSIIPFIALYVLSRLADLFVKDNVSISYTGTNNFPLMVDWSFLVCLNGSQYFCSCPSQANRSLSSLKMCQNYRYSLTFSILFLPTNRLVSSKHRTFFLNLIESKLVMRLY